MEQIKHFMLPENSNSLYEKEAISSISLTKDVAEKINEIVDALNQLGTTDLAWKHEIEGKVNKGVLYMKDNLVNALEDLLKIYDEEIIKRRVTDMYNEEVKNIITPQMFGAVGDGSKDDTNAIQTAIDEANKHGRVLYMPRGVYKISKTILLNGCSIIGEPCNIFGEEGTIIECITKDFTAIKQGSTATKDIMFNLCDLAVRYARVAFEIHYAINSKFERLFAIGCDYGYLLGNNSSVGSMFCEFNNLYTKDCTNGIDIRSKDYFNNNRFNNGFISGTNFAMNIEVLGGYGAIDNVFNNVEFHSERGQGVILKNCLNTIFNHCYFECGGNVVRTLNYCTVVLNDCIYGSYNVDNAMGYENMVYATGGSAFTFNGGTVFLSDNYANKYFFGTGNEATYQNIIVDRAIRKNGTASGFDFFAKPVRTAMYQPEECVVTTGTVTVEASASTDVPFTYTKPFSSIPTVVLYTMRGSNGSGMHTIVKERTKEGGILTVTNKGASANSVSFSVYARLL